MNQTLQDGMDVLTAQQRLQRESVNHMAAAADGAKCSSDGLPVSPAATLQAPALLQLEATVTEVNRYKHLQPRMTLQIEGGEYSGYVRLDAPTGAMEGQRYVVILSPVRAEARQ